MIAIIEGCDLVGKSTLVKALTEKHGWQIVKIRWALRGDSERQRTVSMASAFAPCKHSPVAYRHQPSLSR